MIKEFMYGTIAVFAIMLIYKVLIPVWFQFNASWTAVANAIPMDSDYTAAYSGLSTNETIALNYTFVGLVMIILLYMAIVVLRREGEQYN